MAEPFSEADLLRFFNSLSETEASLREAAHPRYGLEIGLIKLVEMRNVVSIENILERLQSIGQSPQTGSPISKASSASASVTTPTEEKKTLKAETPEISERFDEPPDEFIGAVEPAEPLPQVEIKLPKVPIDFQQNTFRLPPLSAEELEHVDDKRLDESYEEKLIFNGDDLAPMNDVTALVTLLLGSTRSIPAPVSSHSSANGNSGTAVRRAPDLYPDIPEPTDEEPIVLPSLSSNPSDEELREHARAHPAVRSALRVFRAKIVEIETL
jgi:DNA polymerase III gamma/tau subunit